MRVLIVDDEPEALELYSDTFVSYGIEAVVFDNAEDSLRYLESQNVDAIVSDIFMPGLNGIEFFQKLKNSGNFPGIFVMLTGRWSESYNYLLGQGVRMVFHKPFSPEGLALYLMQEFSKKMKPVDGSGDSKNQPKDDER